MQCVVTRFIICISNKIDDLDKGLQKFYQRSSIVIFSDLCNAFKKILDNILGNKYDELMLGQNVGVDADLFFSPLSMRTQ